MSAMPIGSATRRGMLLVSAAIAAWGVTPAALADTTLHFDLPTAPLGVFGVELSQDYLAPVAGIQDGFITSTRFHLQFNTTAAPNPFQDAADLAFQFQPPAGDLPIFTLTGADLGWSGTGTFTADFQTDSLNLPILDFPPDAVFSLWNLRIYSTNDGSPLLGGKLIGSYIEVDVQAVPTPSVLMALAAACVRRSRRRRSAE